MKRPNFIILGQGKAGTSLIWRVMRENPNFAFPAKKELHFFAKGFDKGLPWYDEHFADLPQDTPYIGEISPSYLDPDAVQRIADTLGTDIKVGFVLRRPIEQAFSRYMQNICATPSPYSFERYERFMPARMARVTDAIQLAYDLFGPENMLPMFFEKDIKTKAPTFEAKILSHLGLPPADNAASFLNGPRVNPGVCPQYIHTEDSAVQIVADGVTYEIPPRHLVLCAQKRNSTVIENPDPDQLATAQDCMQSWTTNLTKASYTVLQDKCVLPMAAQLEQQFGFDMDHWRNPPQDLAYSLATPPQRFAIN